ncbi:hypothetical protein CCHL11_06000 [Colletotrichum chlorophyti]|uniref:Glucan 1, 4-alpha-glucosidase n=1 Tax=Colletotrichum chlorophyti TaxID=708187 RepID=A0A1Q8RWL7_9PEZI|nr:hypothetical protein CCHL11_06000 [Colletotrichum chlorophyti]
MDDPWGSPWATTDNSTTPSAGSSNTILEPPPPAFLSAANNLAIPSSHSAWGDDDAFGDWTSPDLNQASNASPWAWGNEGTPTDQLTPTYEPRRKSSTPKWPQSRSASPGLRPPITPSGASPGHPSPDPWANHVSSLTKEEPEPLAQLPQIPDVPPLVLEPAQVEKDPFGPSSDTLEEQSATLESAISAADEVCFGPPEAHQCDKVIRPHEPPDVDDDDGSVSSSNSATSGEDDNETDDDLPDVRHADSPITSIEDNHPQKTTIQRKPSGKVLELVEMYDGIAKKTATTQERSSIPRRSASQEPQPGAEDTLNNGIEEVNSTEGGQVIRRAPTAVDSDSVDLPQVGVRATQSSEEAVKPSRPDHDPFEVDLSQLGLLIPEPSVDEALEPAGDVSDRIIHDSFSSISERKTWYRVSRHESLRKHNAGDDENYVRINWANSTLRQETLKTVRRWMEEDSFGGRAFHGGLARASGNQSFGWDATTAASPVDLDKVFGRKAKRQASFHRPRHSVGVLPPLSTVPIVSSSTTNTPASAQAANNWEGLATFGWSTGAGEDKSSKPSTFTTSLPLAFTGFDNKPKSHASLPAFTKPNALTLPVISTVEKQEEEKRCVAEVEEDDDDEWGDMVSPTTAETTDSTSLSKTGWDPVSTNPSPDTLKTGLSNGNISSESAADELRTGNNDTTGHSRTKSGVRDIGSVISPASASTTPTAVPEPHSQDGSHRPPASLHSFRSSSTAKRPPNILVAAQLTNPLDPSHGQPRVSSEDLRKTPLTTGLETPSTVLARDSTEDSDVVRLIIRNLPDLSYMLR